MAAAAAIKNPSKDFEDATAVEYSMGIKHLGLLVDSSNVESAILRDKLVKLLVDDMITSLVEEELVNGTYKIPLKDEQGNLESIVEIPMSIATTPLSPEESVLMTNLSTPTMDALFENKDLITEVADPRALLTYLASLSDKDLKKITSANGSSASFTIKDTTVSGLTLQTVTVPRTSFFGRMELALQNSTDKPGDIKVLSEWLSERVKAAVKIGNRS